MVVLAQAAHNSWVVKWSLEFPGAPKGVSETLVMRALQKLKEEGESAA